MIRTRACGDLRRELGVYLLGAIAPADRTDVEGHLASCAGCRDQLADLAGLPALLRRLTLDDVDRLVAASSADDSRPQPDRSLGSLLSRAASRKRNRAWSAVAAGAATALAVGAAGTYVALETAPQQAASSALLGAITVRGSDPRYKASAVVRYAGRPWGVQLYVQVDGVAAGTRCAFEVTDSSGQESAAASWTVAASDRGAWYTASSSVPVTSVRGFLVTAGARVLVQISVPRQPTRIGGPR